MFTLSRQHAWQGDEAVQQILVFPHHKMQEIFNKDFAALVEKDGIENASDSNLGAIYKLRAIKRHDGDYIPVIRCGLSGVELWEGYNTYDTAGMALFHCFTHLKNSICGLLDIYHV